LKDLKTPQVEPKNIRGSEVNPIAKWMTATTHACLACALSVVLFSSALPDEKVEARNVTYQLNIPAENLDAALQALALASHHKLLYRAELVAGKTSRALIGTFTTEEAVRQLLSGTDLGFDITPASVVLIRSKDEGKSGDAAVGVQAGAASAAMSSSAPPDATPSDTNGGGKQSSQDFRMAQMGQANTGASTVASTTESSTINQNGGPALTEIIVTAQKRSERLLDVPVPVTAINAQALIDNNQLRLQDYQTLVPGLNVTPDDYGLPLITIRGLTTGPYTNPTVAIVVDDVPFTSFSFIGFGQEAPDLDPNDLQRVEVLRGPQGTLYGASSTGGLIKYVTVDPSTDGVSGRVEGGFSSVYNGAELGYNLRASVNVPLSDTFAVRLSGFTRLDPGYIDDPGLFAKGVNEAEAVGARLSTMWRPSEGVSLKVSALYQHNTVGGSSSADVGQGLGDLQQNDVRGSGAFESKLSAITATLAAKLGNADLTAVSGYTVNNIDTSIDYTNALGECTSNGCGTGFSGFGVSGTPVYNENRATKFTQELRLSVPIGSSVDWLIGTFYTYETDRGTTSILAADPLTGVAVGQWLFNYSPSNTSLQEYAGFTDLTFHVTDRLDVQFGGRESQNKQAVAPVINIGPYEPYLIGNPSPYVSPRFDSKGNAFTYLVTPRFKVSSDFMVYARLASGYRPGGPNLAPGVPSSYRDDTTENYEVGSKLDIFDHALSIDASLYYINWKDIQLSVVEPTGEGYITNGSRAKSQGVELSVESRPLRGMAISAWATWNDAVLTQSFPIAIPGESTYGVVGDRLPNGARVSGSLSLQQDFPLWARVTGFVAGTEAYVGDRLGQFTTTPLRQTYPSYAQTDVRAGAKYESWTYNFFVDNAFDKRAVLDGGIGTFNVAAFNYIRPRTMGLNIAKSFK
jgi:iron complex outermembrane recepter protein